MGSVTMSFKSILSRRISAFETRPNGAEACSYGCNPWIE